VPHEPWLTSRSRARRGDFAPAGRILAIDLFVLCLLYSSLVSFARGADGAIDQLRNQREAGLV
jgi:hypothetical protein